MGVVSWGPAARLIDKRVYRGWADAVAVRRRSLEAVWPELKEPYSKQFREHVQNMIDRGQWN